MPKVSVILPVFNAFNFVDDTILSVLNQTYQDWQLLIIDDCSSDGTYEYVKDRFSDNPKVIVLKTSINSGAGITRNLGLEMASGKFIAFLDADDIWLPEKIEKQVAFIEAKNCAIVHTSYSFIDEHGCDVLGRVEASSFVNLHSYMRNTEIGMSTAMVNKNIVGDFYFHPMRTRQDTRLWLELLGRGYVANGLNQNLVKYRVRAGQISGNKMKVAFRTLKLYLNVKDIPIHKRIINYCFYAFNGVIKRLK